MSDSIDPISYRRKLKQDEIDFRADLYFFRRSLDALLRIQNPTKSILSKIEIRKKQIQGLFDSKRSARKANEERLMSLEKEPTQTRKKK